MGLQGERLKVEEHLDDAGMAKAASDDKHLSAESTSVSGSEGKHLSGDTPSTSLSEDKHLSGDSYLSAEDDTRYASARSGSRRVTPEARELSAEAKVPVDSLCDPRNTNLDFFHAEASFDQDIFEGQFTKVKGLSECCRGDGKVELHRWTKAACGGSSWAHTAGSYSNAVVKRVLSSRVGSNVGKERNERIVCRGHSGRHAEDCLNEIGVYCYLARQADLPQFILRMHAVFQSGPDVWMVLEHANSGDLFAVVQKLKREGTSLSMDQLMTWMWQLLQAVLYLHSHCIGHRDISMENVLLCDGVVRLMDFGQAVQTHTAGGELFRYFNALGKPYYRPAECHVPVSKTVQVNVPKDARPGELAFVQTTDGDCLCDVLLPDTAVPGHPCMAEPWGYTVPPVDIFACGVCFFIMTTGMPPWRNATLSDPHFTWVHQCGISQLLKHWKKPLPAPADELLTAMVHSVPTKRPSAQRCLSSRWFEPMCGADMPVHPSAPSGGRRPTSASHRGHASVGGTAAELLFGSLSAEIRAGSTGGDPYTKPLTQRSVAVPISDMLHSSPSFAFAGDFYRMPEEDYTRSAVVSPEALTFQRFSGNDCPPSIPNDDSFELEPTAFYVHGKEPVKLGNHIINFLSMAAGAVVTKVNTKKWTIKADVDGESGACTMKVRVYSAGEGRHAIEFQRRGGETTALHNVFDQAAEHLITQQKKSKAADAESNGAAKPNKKEGKEASSQQSPPSVQRSSSSTSSSCPVPPTGVRPPRKSLPAPVNRTISTNSKSGTLLAPENLPARPCSEPANLAVGSGLNAVRSRSRAGSTRFGANGRKPPAARMNATT
jgi:serine/threonine protein kinase